LSGLLRIVGPALPNSPLRLVCLVFCPAQLGVSIGEHFLGYCGPQHVARVLQDMGCRRVDLADSA
jgi:hypothetical protein